MAYVVKNEGSWVLFTKSNYLLNRALLNRGLGVPNTGWSICTGQDVLWYSPDDVYYVFGAFSILKY